MQLFLTDGRYHREPLPCEARREWCEGILAAAADAADADWVWCDDFLRSGGPVGRQAMGGGSCCRRARAARACALRSRVCRAAKEPPPGARPLSSSNHQDAPVMTRGAPSGPCIPLPPAQEGRRVGRVVRAPGRGGLPLLG